MLIKNSEKRENYFKSKKFCEGACLEKKNEFIKNGILGDPNLKEKQEIDDLKLFENWNFENYLKIEI